MFKLSKMKTIQTLYTVNTEYSADTIEWCPATGYHEYFICGTYHLEENNRTISNAPTRRKGRVTLYKYQANDNQLIECDAKDTAAILDTKWTMFQPNRPVVAAASALGEVLLFGLDGNQLMQLSTVHLDVEAETLLTLSIAWNSNENFDQMLLASDSKGFISLLRPTEATFDIISRWNSHSFEAWTCCFDHWNPNVVYSGGDDAIVHVFDTRSADSSIPLKIRTNQSHMAGVTSLLSHPEKEHTLITGSYDDHLRIFDTRSFKQPLASLNLSGGIWRIKPDPFNKDLLLCPCMYHNTSIIELDETGAAPKIVAEYYEHKSINYGADWCRATTDDMIIGTCSFYDQKLCISKVSDAVGDGPGKSPK